GIHSGPEAWRRRAVPEGMLIESSVRSRGAWTVPLPAHLDSHSTVVFAFGASGYLTDDAPFADLRAAFPTSHIVGCSTAGEIAGREILDGSISVVVARFERKEIKSAVHPITLETSFDVGAALARTVSRDDLTGCFVLGSGHDVNGSALTDG